MIDRRAFLGASFGLLLAPLARVAGAQPERRSTVTGLSFETRSALAKSPFVYISPLKANGRESTCHGEVWFAWLDSSVVIITAKDRWKARAVDAGLTRARVWVGDHGRWKKTFGTNDAYRNAPSFDARGSFVRDEALLERMIAVYEEKYPEEIGTWRDRFRKGFADGSRVLIRYVPGTSRT